MTQTGKTRSEKRFFAGGGFFTDDRHARFIAPQPPELRGTTNAVYPLRLNTGRVRDQWHTMTRTGKSPRLAAHSSEPFVEINPADAGVAGVTDGGFARVTTRHGTTILKVIIAAGQRRGSIFAPIHWSDATAGHARVGEMSASQNDPYSGQPEFEGNARARRTGRIRLSRIRAYAPPGHAAGRNMVCTAGRCWGLWPSLCNQPTALHLA